MKYIMKYFRAKNFMKFYITTRNVIHKVTNTNDQNQYLTGCRRSDVINERAKQAQQEV